MHIIIRLGLSVLSFSGESCCRFRRTNSMELVVYVTRLSLNLCCAIRVIHILQPSVGFLFLRMARVKKRCSASSGGVICEYRTLDRLPYNMQLVLNFRVVTQILSFLPEDFVYCTLYRQHLTKVLRFCLGFRYGFLKWYGRRL